MRHVSLPPALALPPPPPPAPTHKGLWPERRCMFGHTVRMLCPHTRARTCTPSEQFSITQKCGLYSTSFAIALHGPSFVRRTTHAPPHQRHRAIPHRIKPYTAALGTGRVRRLFALLCSSWRTSVVRSLNILGRRCSAVDASPLLIWFWGVLSSCLVPGTHAQVASSECGAMASVQWGGQPCTCTRIHTCAHVHAAAGCRICTTQCFGCASASKHAGGVGGVMTHLTCMHVMSCRTCRVKLTVSCEGLRQADRLSPKGLI